MMHASMKHLRYGVLATVLFCLAYPAAAADIKVLCIPGMKASIDALIPEFERISGHKVFGPTGIGAVYGRRELLETMPPWQGGGNMIQDVTFEQTVYQPPPARL